MRTLYHLWLSPFSRKIRLILAEKGLEFDMVVEKTWLRRPEFMKLNPAGAVPVLVEDELTLSGSQAIAEYLEEVHPSPNLIGQTPVQRAEVRRLVGWFDDTFAQDVTRNLLYEKVMKRLKGEGQPSSAAIRAGHHNIHTHLDYIGFLMQRRRWLAGEEFSLADIAAAAQLSSLDYLGDVPWRKHEGAKNWYARIKSRPSFRPLLADHVAGLAPASHYADLDF